LRERAPFGAGWPKFIFHDAVALRLMPTAEQAFAEYSLAIVEDDDRIIAGGWGVPLSWTGEVDDLPDGWDGALERAVETREQGIEPNAFCAMATEVVETARGAGLAGKVLTALRERAAQRGLARMIAPARPTLKHRYPLVPIARYASWTTADGLPFDPWLRTHVRCGARILSATDAAMRIVASVDEWEAMSEMAFPETGHYVVPQALALVHIDLEANRGTYVEPAIWMQHT
jgi:GNAT superfamily N-acetyltransferase